MIEGAARHVEWARGGAASVVSADADSIRLRSTIPSPPGSRIVGTVRREGERPPFELRVKIHGCKRQEDGSFVLEGRPLDLTRDARAHLSALALEAPRAPET